MHGFTLLIGDEGTLLYPPLRLKKEPLFMIGHEEDALGSIAVMLNEAPRTPVHLLMDVRTQHIKKEEHPPLSYLDRKKLLARRVKQAFPKTRLRQFLLQDTKEALLVSLDETALIERYLCFLRKLSNPLSGLSLLPCELESLLPKLIPNPHRNWGMLILYQQTGGFRQIVTHKGRLIFTRLTPPLPETTSADFIEERLNQDILATRNYLGRFGLKRLSKISVTAIMPPPWQGIKLDQCEYRVLLPSAAAQLTETVYPHNWENGADLFSILTARRRFLWKSRLFLPEDKTRFYHDVMRYAGFCAAFLILILALARIAFFGFSAIKDYHEITELNQDVAELNEEFETLKKSLHAPRSSLNDLRQAVEKERFYTQPILTPEEILSSIDALTEKQARAHKVTWQQNRIEIEFDLNQTDTMSRADILAQVEALKTTLEKELTDYQIKIINYPFPNLPTETITNKGTGKTPARATFLFSKKKEEA